MTLKKNLKLTYNIASVELFTQSYLVWKETYIYRIIEIDKDPQKCAFV